MKKKILIVLLALIFISPELVKADTKEPPIIKWENVDIKPESVYRGTVLLCDAGDGYIAIDNNNEIAKYNYDGTKEKTIISNFKFTENVSAALVDGNNLVILTYNDTIYKYSLDGDLITTTKVETDVYLYSLNITLGKDGYYISSDYNQNYILKLDKNLNKINEYIFNDYINYDEYTYCITENDEVIVIQNKDDYQTKVITKLDSNLNFISQEEKTGTTIDDFNIYYTLKEIPDGYITIGRNYNGSTIAKLDKNFNEEWMTSYDDTTPYFTDVEVVSDGYIVIGYHDTGNNSSTPILIKYDSSGNVMYNINYTTDAFSNDRNSYPFEKIIVLSDDDFIVYSNVGVAHYTEYNGSITVRYGYNEYKITTNIIGKGTLNPSLETSVAGNKITYTATPDTGYILKNITVTTASGEVIKTTDNSFIMPDEDVTIEAEFVKEITTNPNTGNIIMIITGILLITILGTVIALYYKKKIAQKRG